MFPEGEDPAQYREEVLRRLRCFIECARENDIVLLHENEKAIYGDNAAGAWICSELFGAHFRCTFDFANFVQCKQDTQEAFEMLKPYIDYVHVKDAQWRTGKWFPLVRAMATCWKSSPSWTREAMRCAESGTPSGGFCRS